MTSHSDTSSLQTLKAFKGCAYGDRDKLAQRFTQYLDHRNTEKGAYVANLNGAWGTGKTFFVDNWCQQLKENNRLAIKIDAWESDYLKDPLAIIVAELLKQLKEQSKLKDYSSFERKIGHIFTHLAKSTLATAVTGAGQFFLGEDNFKSYKTVLQESALAATNISNYKKRPEDERLGEFGIEVFKTHNKHKAFVIEFKKLFQNLLIEANKSLSPVTLNDNKAEKTKTYIFIDELDRCRPTYAIEMLETVKHLFNIPNLIFVLSTDTGQLEHSIKAVYGEGFDAREYLSRFFEQRLLLPAPDHFTFLKSMNSFESLGLDVNSQHLFPAIDTKEKVSAVLGMFCELNQISLRRTLQFADKLEAILLEFIFEENNAMASLNLFELVACLLTRDFYPIQAQNLSWNAIYLDDKWTKENANKLKEELKPITPNKPYQDLIKTILDWSEEVLSNPHKQYREHIYKSKFGTSLSQSKNQLIQTIDSDIFRNFTASHKWVNWSSEIDSKENNRHFLTKEKVDELVTLTSSQIGFVNDTESNSVPIFGSSRRR